MDWARTPPPAPMAIRKDPRGLSEEEVASSSAHVHLINRQPLHASVRFVETVLAPAMCRSPSRNFHITTKVRASGFDPRPGWQEMEKASVSFVRWGYRRKASARSVGTRDDTTYAVQFMENRDATARQLQALRRFSGAKAREREREREQTQRKGKSVNLANQIKAKIFWN